LVYERKLAENINTHTKSFYKDIKWKRIVKVDVGPLEDGNGGVIMGNSEMAEALNQYFVSVFTVEDNNSVPKTAVNAVELCKITITREKVFSKLKGLKVDKFSGPDGLHPRLLKEVTAEIVDALVLIFQNSLDSRKVPVPVDWKHANVMPLFKK